MEPGAILVFESFYQKGDQADRNPRSEGLMGSKGPSFSIASLYVARIRPNKFSRRNCLILGWRSKIYKIAR